VKLNYGPVVSIAAVLACLIGPAAGVAAEKADDAKTAGVREGPVVGRARDAGVGELAPDLTFRDLAGTTHRLSGFRGKPVVIAFTGTGCPVARKYLPTLAELQRTYSAKGVTFILVNPQATETPDAMRKAVTEAGYRGLYAHDQAGSATAALGASSTTETILLDAARTVVYRGAADDQFGLGYALDKPRKTFLVDAIEATLGGRRPDVAATSAPGCVLEPKGQAAAVVEPPPPAVTFHNRISRIVQQSCQSCHRAGENGPFELATFADVRDHLPMIRKVVGNRTMPPWFADPKVGHWANDASLPERDQRDLLAWDAAGAPEGDAADAPLPRAFTPGWRIGKPDAVFTAAAPQTIPAKGPIKYRYVVVDTNLERDRWVKAVEIRSDQPQVLHHLLAFLTFPKGDARAKDYPDPRGGLDGYFAGLVPGQAATTFPAGTAKLLPKGAKIILQVHYTPNGTEVVDHPRIGFVFADAPPEHEVLTVAAHNERFRIPPGAAEYKVVADYRFRGDTRILSFNPHCHVRGKAWRYELLYPDGRAETVLDVPRYDFNWQLEYHLAHPLDVPTGTTLRVTAWYDNSTANPANPNPKATVGFGEQTYEEMMIGYVTGHRLP
jgi:thiol-disulfide isomerase/thioredoxin